MKRLITTLFLFLLISESAYGQKVILDESNLLPNKVYMQIVNLEGEKVVRVVKNSSVKEADEPTFVKIKNTNFKNGSIEVEVLSRLLPTAAPTDRGFIGLVFRIDDDMNSKFESIYIRPTNGRAEDQVRRNHSIQYFSYPNFKYERLRKESPEKYESYADMGLNEWITIKIEVKDSQAKLFLNKNKYPSLIVNDLKHGPDETGAIGLFVDVGTEGYFRNLKIIPSSPEPTGK
ncbi:family 16 glycoside hydrolase [Chryseobacterium geocarposphaerae]|uniref:3-keto-alpha-glucoside-1,2-lyase/3-keto-2-hydroxy-glucal hydratase domain-containing protein n=1 Tax=Chryseobacterium geocarposphaerae TaxID=1416776 RepID=A0A2M9BXW0_9FLAO|nr:family 16 glycoside hydrolase [Chryseobacterium geocarposphaerae]PJJ62915.1 hypothetical protein CLV73_3429 [Chryseobacterium geocarposphaerae]